MLKMTDSHEMLTVCLKRWIVGGGGAGGGRARGEGGRGKGEKQEGRSANANFCVKTRTQDVISLYLMSSETFERTSNENLRSG